MIPGSSETNEGVSLGSPQGDVAHCARTLFSLRVLYTLNTSPQYLLARQKRKVQAVPISADKDEDKDDSRAPSGSNAVGGTISKQCYAKVSLKTCLETVCNASPELVCDRSRDYSVYVVDPLELPLSDEHTPHVSKQTAVDSPSGSTLFPWGEGVSVGMGLMSWCLAGNGASLAGCEDEDYVIGKVVKDRGADALEVVMSLRETAAQTQHQHALSLSSWGIPAPALSTNIQPFPPAAQIPSPLFNLNTPPIPSSSRSSSPIKKSHLGYFPQPKGNSASETLHPSNPVSTPASNQSVDRPARPRTKRIGRPPGAKTHPEKRARQLAIQMHKEKLERLQNILKMQNGEEYDKTLISTSDCETKVTKEIIAHEQKLLEELQSRPLIIDGPRYTTEPLPRRASSPAAPIPLVETTPRKQKAKAAAGALPSALSGSSNAIGGACQSPHEIVQAATKDEQGAGILFALLSSILSKVDEPPDNNATISGPTRGNETSNGKQTLPPPSDSLAHALQLLLPYVQSHGTQQSVISEALPRTKANTINHPHVAFERPGAPHVLQSQSQHPYSRLFRTSEESFHSNDEPLGRKTQTSKAVVPKVREDAHPVPGGGWARGRNIVPRSTSLSQTGAGTRSGNAAGNSLVSPLSASAISTAPDKENLPPVNHKQLKRSLSQSVGTKENETGAIGNSFKSGLKKRRQEETVKGPKSSSTNRVMTGSMKSNLGALTSSPVRRSSTAPSLPIVAFSEPDYLSHRSLATLPKCTETSDKSSMPLIVSSTISASAIVHPRTPPKGDPSLNDEGAESLFTPRGPCPASEVDDVLQCGSSPISTHALRKRAPSTSAENDDERSAGHASTGWDLPPSSPPPPTSPILPDNDFTTENQMDWTSAMQVPSELDVETDKSGTDGRFEDHPATISSVDGSTPVAGIQDLEDYVSSNHLSTFETTISDFVASSDDVLNTSELGHDNEGNYGMGLDVDELWSSLGPVIAQAQVDSDTHAGIDSEFYGLIRDQNFEEQCAVDPIKLAEDLKTLFGGCVL